MELTPNGRLALASNMLCPPIPPLSAAASLVGHCLWCLISLRIASRIAAMNAAPKTEDGILIGLLPIFLLALIGMREWKHGGNRVEQVTETTDFFVATAK